MRKYRNRSRLDWGELLDNYWQAILICFLAGFLGVLAGISFGQVATESFLVVVSLLLGFFLIGLIIASFVHTSFKATLNEAQKEGYIKEYNALQMILLELEENSKAKLSTDLKTDSWNFLKYEVSLFSNFLYNDLVDLYKAIDLLKKEEKSEGIKEKLQDDLDIITIMAKLRAEQTEVRASIKNKIWSH